jgi:hypothetical protein
LIRILTVVTGCHALTNILLAGLLWRASWANTSGLGQYLSSALPPWFIPSMFAGIGVFAFIGIWFRLIARVAFYWGGFLTGGLGLAAFDYGTPVSGVFLIYVGLLKVMIVELSIAVVREQKKDVEVREIITEIQDDHAV